MEANRMATTKKKKSPGKKKVNPSKVRLRDLDARKGKVAGGGQMGGGFSGFSGVIKPR
jgi:hypothetical protein